MCRWLLIFLFLLPVETIVFSQQILDFDKLSMDNGFTSSRANAIIQDRKGFIWIGTWNGLNKYDGYKSEIYRPSYHDTSAISNREVLALLEDYAGKIWVGTTAGLNCINPETGEIQRYEFKSRIISLFEDSNHVIWIGTWNGGLFKLNPHTGETENYITTDIVSDIYEDSRSNLWIATYYGLVNFDRNTTGYVRYLPDNGSTSSISHSVVTQIEESTDGALWVSTWGGGINKILVHPNKDSVQFIHYKAHNKKGSLSSNVVYRLHYDRFGNLWAGTWDSGLSLLEPSEQKKSPEEAKFYTYLSDLSNPFSISGNNISSLFVDRTGVLWVGNSKIDRTSIIKTGFTRYNTMKFVDGLFTTSSVRSFVSQDSLIWVGTEDELKLFRNENKRLVQVKEIQNTSFRSGNKTYTNNSALSLLTTEDGLWVGTEDAGLFLYPHRSAIEDENPKFRFFNRDTDPSLPGNKVCNLFQSIKYPGVIWVGTMQNGFAKLTIKNEIVKIQKFTIGYDDASISDHNIRSIVEDRQGKVWIGTQNGLNCYDPETNTFRKYFYSLLDTNSINDNVVNIVHEDISGNLWIGTNMGLNKKKIRRLKSGEEEVYFKGYPNVNFLNNEIITNILEDDSRNLWIGLYRGLIKFDVINESVEKEYFTKEYQHLIVERQSASEVEGGMFLLGGINGFLTFYPDSLLKNAQPPKVCLTDLLIYNESIKERMAMDKLSVSYAESIRLSYKDKILTFVFSAMDFKDPQKNEYAYFLEGFDKKWNMVGVRNTATYTNIPPGDYVFKVKSSNSDGIWNDEPLTMKLKISPPFWRTTVAYIFYGVLFIGLLYFFKQYSIIEVREKGRILIEHLQYEKESELNELKSRFFTNITHEFRTPLTLILGPAEELLKNRELTQFSKRQAELIQRNAQRLLRLVNQLMEFRKVEKGKMEVYLQKSDVSVLLYDLYDSFKSMADSKNIEFELNIRNQELFAMIDYEKFEKVMFNLLSNAFKYSEDGGQIVINAGIIKNKKSEEILEIEVEDTGIGIAEEHKERVFERFFQANVKKIQSTGGIGLYLSKTFIELHQGEIELESELGKGSCFRLHIPVHNINAQMLIEEGVKKGVVNQSIDGVGGAALETEEVTESNEFIDDKMHQVLIVEDDSELNEFIVSGLSKDFKVVGTFNGREGLELARKINPDIIVTDIMMPELDGIELCKMLRKDLSTSHIPVIFLTAKTMREDEIEGLKIGAVDYIYKPFNLISLRLKIKNIISNRKNVQGKLRADKILEPEEIELSSLDEKFLKDAVEAVNKHLDDPTFDVDKFSEVIGISSNQAYRKIKALTGQTAKEFIRNQRLKTSANMFLQKKRSISEIIYMVGFSSPSYFTRCFREYYGCTPKEYIEKDGKM